MPSVAPPSPLEIHRKLSVHSVVKPVVASGAESDSDSALSPDILSSTVAGLSGTSAGVGPLSSIAEGRAGSGEDSEDEEDVEEGGWKSADVPSRPSADELVIKAGYLWKKGERRKTWKKRWFVLRPAHLAYYKSSAEYQLLRLLELSDVHSCTKVALKKHENTFGLISPVRTFYLQAKTTGEVSDWVKAIEETRHTLLRTSTQNSATSPIPIPRNRSNSRSQPPVTPSPPSHFTHSQNVTSSDSEDASPGGYRTYSNVSSTQRPDIPSSPTKSNFTFDPTKIILSGYLMKCGSKRRNWRKRWFVLSGDKLVYSASHMDTKIHRQFLFADILDALEYTPAVHRQNPTAGIPSSPVAALPLPDSGADSQGRTFKVVTTKRNLLLCAPTEEDEIKWLGAIRALIARRTGGEPAATKAKTRRLSASGATSSGFSGVESVIQTKS